MMTQEGVERSVVWRRQHAGGNRVGQQPERALGAPCAQSTSLFYLAGSNPKCPGIQNECQAP